MRFGRFLYPGPADVHPDVLASMQRGMIPHRGAAMEALLSRMQPRLQALFRTSLPVFLGTCSATGFMEAAIRGGVEHRVLVIIGGAFGERFADIAERCGKEVLRAVVHEGRTLEPDHLARFLDGPAVDAVAMVHSETSTGALAPLEDLARVVHSRKNVMLLVDAASSLGGVPLETDRWGLDFVLTGSQKALALPPGLALGVASPRLVERARRLSERGRYLDVVAYHKSATRNQPLTTPVLPLYYALDFQLERIEAQGGVEARWRRHREMLLAAEQWVAGQDAYRYLPPEGRRSWTVSCLKVPERLTSTQIVERLESRGWTIAQGYGPLREATIRIGHMGDVGVEQVRNLLEELPFGG